MGLQTLLLRIKIMHKPRVVLNATEASLTAEEIIASSNYTPGFAPQPPPPSSNEVIDKLTILKNMIDSEDNKVKRISTTKDQIMRSSLSIASGEF